MVYDKNNVPSDIALLQELVIHQSQTISALTEEVRRLTTLMEKFFGKSSEKLPKKDETPEKQASKDLTGTPVKKEKNGLVRVAENISTASARSEASNFISSRWSFMSSYKY